MKKIPKEIDKLLDQNGFPEFFAIWNDKRDLLYEKICNCLDRFSLKGTEREDISRRIALLVPSLCVGQKARSELRKKFKDHPTLVNTILRNNNPVKERKEYFVKQLEVLEWLKGNERLMRNLKIDSRLLDKEICLAKLQANRFIKERATELKSYKLERDYLFWGLKLAGLGQTKQIEFYLSMLEEFDFEGLAGRRPEGINTRLRNWQREAMKNKFVRLPPEIENLIYTI